MRHKVFYLSVSKVLFSCRSTMLYNYHISLALYQYMSDDLKLLHWFSSLPVVRKMPRRVQIFFFRITKIVCLLVLSKVTFALGFLFMEEWSRAIYQFDPSSAGGISGGSSTPGPSENFWLFSSSIVGEDSHGQERGSPSFSVMFPDNFGDSPKATMSAGQSQNSVEEFKDCMNSLPQQGGEPDAANAGPSGIMPAHDSTSNPINQEAETSRREVEQREQPGQVEAEEEVDIWRISLPSFPFKEGILFRKCHNQLLSYLLLIQWHFLLFCFA